MRAAQQSVDASGNPLGLVEGPDVSERGYRNWTASDAVARALYFRFLKRITAHVMNFLTSLVLPIDRLDYYDEPKDDRA